MRAVVKIKQTGGKGLSYQARYIAGSELNKEREGEKPRPLFTNVGHETLTYRGANRFLTGGQGDPLKADLIHLMVSFQNEDFEALGKDDEERKAALREVVRGAMEKTKIDLGAREWRWVGGVHLNTDHPHIHLLIHKEITDENGKPDRLGLIRKRLLPGRVAGSGSEVRPTEGVIGGHFVEALDRAVKLEALRQGKATPSPALTALLTGLESRRNEREILNLEASLYEVSLHKVQTSRQLRASYESLTDYERRYLSEKITERRQAIARERGSDESVLLEAVQNRPSPGGRDLTYEVIARGQASASGRPFDLLRDLRSAFEDRAQDGLSHETQHGKADWLSAYSQWLRDDYERGAVIKGQVLVIPAEGFELNTQIHDRPLFIHELRYALWRIDDPEKATEFHKLGTTIAGKNANAGGQAAFFSSYYGLLDRERGEEEGRKLESDETAARAEALDLTLGRMRELAALMEELETNLSIEVRRPDLVVSLEQRRESSLSALYSEPVFDEAEEGEREAGKRPKGSSYVFNTAARKVNLSDESLRLPEGISQETRERLVRHTLPWIDQEIESGVNRSEILEKINQFYYEWGDPSHLTLAERLEKEKDAYHRIGYFIKAYAGERIRIREQRDPAASVRPFRFTIDELPPGLTREARARLTDETMPWIDKQIESGAGQADIYKWVKQRFHGSELTPEDLTGLLVAIPGLPREDTVERSRIVRFCQGYLDKRLNDPETRELNRSQKFREAHQQLAEARSASELDQAIIWVFKEGRLNWRQRALLFSGRTSDHYTREMRVLRISFGLSREERAVYAREIEAGKREPSPALKQLLDELKRRNTPGSIGHYRASLLNEEMNNPGKFDLHGLHKQLPTWERDYLFLKAEERKERILNMERTRNETSPRIGASMPARASRGNESIREYLAERKAREEALLKGAEDISPEERAAIRERASRQAWDRLVPEEVFAEEPSDAARELSDLIAELREKTQPQARLASEVLDRFSLDKTGHPYDKIPAETFGKLDSKDAEQLQAYKQYADQTLEELYRGFEKIDVLRKDIELSREGREQSGDDLAAEATNAPAIQAATIQSEAASASRDPDATVRAAAPKDASGRQTPPAGRSFGAPPTESRSYREYTAAAAEIEQRLLEEAIREKQNTNKDRLEIMTADPLLSREEKLEIRAVATNLALKRFEPQRILAKDPAVLPLLSLRETVRQMRNESQPQARESARQLDDFIRSRGLDRFIAGKTDYYYSGDQLPKDSLKELTPADRKAFEALDKEANVTFREFKAGFRAIDLLRLEVDWARNGHASTKDERQSKARSGHDGPGNRNSSSNGPQAHGQKSGTMASPPKRNADPASERLNDRRILGKAIIAQVLSDAATLDHEIARDYGKTFRFKILDASLGDKRKISDLDVNRRANAHGDRVADEGGFERYDERLEIRLQVSGADLFYHSTTLDEHAKKLDQLARELETKARHALAAHQHAERLAEEVREKYQNLGQPLPTPLVEREALVKAQDEAIEHRFASHTERLEWLRVALAEEHGQPMRTETEAARLSAQLFTAGTDLRAQETLAIRFDETRHLRQWEIKTDWQGKTRIEKYSLANVNREVKRLTDEAQVLGDRKMHLDPAQRREAKVELERMNQIRAVVVEKIQERQGEFQERVAEAGKLFDTLTRAYERESSFREQLGLEMPAPQFTRRELELAAYNIETARDAEGLRQLTQFEKQFNEYADQKERFESAEVSGRVPARALMAEIFHHESVERLRALEQRGGRHSVLIETPDGNLVTYRLNDTYPRSSAEWALRPLLELVSEKARAEREIRTSVQEAYAQYETRLRDDVALHRVYLETAREIAYEQAAERARVAGRELTEPSLALTAEQAMRIEIFATRQTDQELRRELLDLARGSDISRFDAFSRSQTRSSEAEPAREPPVHDTGRAR